MSPATFVALLFHSAGKTVCFVGMFVCVSLLVCCDPSLYSGTCVTVFNPFILCCLFILVVVLLVLTIQISSFFNGKVLPVYCFYEIKLARLVMLNFRGILCPMLIHG